MSGTAVASTHGTAPGLPQVRFFCFYSLSSSLDGIYSDLFRVSLLSFHLCAVDEHVFSCLPFVK